MPTIDERIVQMKFDNEQFERNVSTSMNTLAKLKQSLQFKNLGDSLKNIEIATDSLNDRLSNLEYSVQKVANVFTPLGRIGQKIFDDIADRAVQAGKAIADAFTGFGDIGAGQKKYETQTTAVQTITNATGKSVAEVEGVLEKLQKYTDETSYDFAEMVSSIGKFTSVGVELEKAEKAMEGIANEAALSGAGKAEANRAMYNFAQALSAGYVKLIDWKSIENANMATKEFKEELIKTAIELGTIEGKGEAVGAIMKQTKKATKTAAAEFKETEINYKSFNETLSEGWLTSDVLIETLNRYADTSGELGDLGKRAYQAAKEALKWSDAIDAVHDAVSSGWMKTFKLIFGDLDEARVWWTFVADGLTEYTDIFTSYRNEVLEAWHTQGGYTKFIESAMSIWTTFMDTVYAVRDALSQVIPAFDAEDLLAITDKIHTAALNLREAFKFADRDDEGELIENRSAAMERFQNIVRGVAAQVEIVRNFIGSLLNAAGRVIGMFRPLVDVLFRFWSMTSEMWQNLNNELKDTDAYGKLSDRIVKFFGPVGDIIQRVSNGINTLINVYAKWLKAFGKQNTFSNFYEFLKAYTDGTPFGIIFKAIDVAVGVFNTLKNTVGKVVDFIIGKIDEFRQKWGWVSSIDQVLFMIEYHLEKIPIIGNLFKSADGKFDGNRLISIKDSIVEFVTGIAAAFQNGDIITYVKDFFGNLWNSFINGVQNGPFQKILQGIQIAGYLVVYAIQSVLTKIKELFNKITGGFNSDENGTNPIVAFFTDIWETLKTIPEQADKIGEKIGEIKDKIGNAIVTGIQTIKTFFAEKAKSLFGGIQDTAGGFVGAIASFFQGLPGKIMSIVWPAIGVVAVLAIKDISKSIKNVSEWIKGFGKKEEEKKDTVGDTIMKIAGSLAVLAGIAAVLASLDHDEVGRAFAMMEMLLMSLVGAAAVLALINKKMDGVGEIGSQMLQFASSIGVLAVGIFMMMNVLKWAIKPENLGYFVGSLLLIAGFIAALGTIQILIAKQAAKSDNGTANSHIDGLLDMCKGIVSIVQGLAILMLVMKGIGDWGIILGAMAFVGLALAGLGFLMYKMTELASKAPEKAEGKLEATVKGFIPMTIALLGVVFAMGKVAKMIKQYGWGETAAAFVAVAAFVAGMAYIVYQFNKQGEEGEDDKKGIIKTISIVLAMVGIALAAHIFAEAVKKVKDVPIENLLAFIGGIVALVGIIGFLGSTAGTGGAVGIIAVAAALAAGLALIGLGVALLGTFAGAGIEAGTQAIWIMGSRLGQFSDMIADINWDNVKKVVSFITVDLLKMWAAMVAVDFNSFSEKLIQLARSGSAINAFGKLISAITEETLAASKRVISLISNTKTAMTVATGISIPDFITNGGLTRLAASLNNYSSLISSITESSAASASAKQIAVDAKEISDSISQINLADGTNETLTNLGSALNLYYDSLSTISTDEDGNVQVPTVDSQMISQAFSALAEAVPVDDIAKISSYAAGGDNDLTQMAIGINALGTALGNYGDNIGTLDSGKVKSANEVLDELAKVNRDLNPRNIFTQLFGDKSEDTKSLTSFADDITALGDALGKYGTNIGTLEKGKVTNANDVLNELIKVTGVLTAEDALPKVFKFLGVDKTTLTDFATDIGLLGTNLGTYGDSIGTLSTEKISKANRVLRTVLKTSQDLPNSGGWISFLIGDNTLEKFATNLGDLGRGLNTFSECVASADFIKVDSAVSAVERLVTSFNTLDASGGAWQLLSGSKSFASLGSGLGELGTKLTEFQTNAGSVTYSSVEGAFSVIEKIIELYNSLSMENLYDFNSNDKLVHAGEALKQLVETVASLKTLTDDNGNLFIQSFIDVGKMIVNAIKLGFMNKEAIEQAQEELKTTIGTIRGTGETEAESFTSVGIAIVNQIAEGIRDEDATNEVIKAILDLMKRIKTEAKNSIIGDTIEDYADSVDNSIRGSSSAGASQKGMKTGYTGRKGAKDPSVTGKALSSKSTEELTGAVEDNTDALKDTTKTVKVDDYAGAIASSEKELGKQTSEWTDAVEENTKVVSKATTSLTKEDFSYLNGVQRRSSTVWEKLYKTSQDILSGQKTEIKSNGKTRPVTQDDIKKATNIIKWIESEVNRIKKQTSRPASSNEDTGKTKKQQEGLEHAIAENTEAVKKTKSTKFDESMLDNLNGIDRKSAKRWKELYSFWKDAVSGKIKETTRNGKPYTITEKDIDLFKRNMKQVEQAALKIENQQSRATTLSESKDAKKLIDLASKTGAGSSSDDIKELQKRLNEIGVLEKQISEDGVYGEETSKAVKEFYSAYNKSVAENKKKESNNYDPAQDPKKTGTFGYLDPDLYEYYDPDKRLAGFKHTAKKGDSGDYIRWLQEELQTLGYYNMFNADEFNTYGKETAKAVRKYQQDRGLEVTGEWDEATIEQAQKDQTEYERDILNNVKGISDDLKVGDQGRDVRTLDNFLTELENRDYALWSRGASGIEAAFKGAPVPYSGSEGRVTFLDSSDAILELQDILGLEKTGVWDEATRKAIASFETFDDIVEKLREEYAKHYGEDTEYGIQNGSIGKSEWMEAAGEEVEKTGNALLGQLESVVDLISEVINVPKETLMPIVESALSKMDANNIDAGEVSEKLLDAISEGLGIEIPSMAKPFVSGIVEQFIGPLLEKFSGLDGISTIGDLFGGKGVTEANESVKKSSESLSESADKLSNAAENVENKSEEIQASNALTDEKARQSMEEIARMYKENPEGVAQNNVSVEEIYEALKTYEYDDSNLPENGTTMYVNGKLIDVTGVMDALSSESSEDRIKKVTELLKGTSEFSLSNLLDGVDINGLAEKLGVSGEEVVTALVKPISEAIASGDVSNLKDNLISSLTENFGEKAKALMSENGTNLVQGLIDSVGSKFTDAANITEDLGDVMNTAFTNLTQIASPSKLYEYYGQMMIEGLILGLSNGASRVANMARYVARQAYEAAKHELGINSPSERFSWVGQMVCEGFALGLDNYSELVGTASSSMADLAIDNAINGVSRLYDSIGSETAPMPSVRPVVDDSQPAAMAQSSGFTQTDSETLIRLATSSDMVSTIAAAIQTNVAAIKESVDKGNADIIAEFKSLNEHIDALDRDIMNTKIYLDSNAIVAGTVSKMDRALGQRYFNSGGRR